ncbi:MAG: DNA-binding MarR family transcriptional regulator [Polyangiales bacterium]
MIQSQKRAHEVLISIRQIVRRVSEHSKYLSREVGLTVPQLLCLKAIGEMEDEHEEITVAMVGQRVHLSPATVSRIIDRVVRADLVARERRSKDRRRVCLSLTPAGLERFQTLPTPLQEKFVKRFAELAEEDQLELLSALSRITTLMDATDLDAAPMFAPGEHVNTDAED